MSVLDSGGTSLLRDSVRRAVAELDAGRELSSEAAPIEDIARRHWDTARELGWFGVLVDEDDGGLGMGCTEVLELSEELGAGLFCAPWPATAVLTPVFFRWARRRSASAAQLEALAGGNVCVSLATPVTGAPFPDSGPDGDQPRWLAEYPEIATHYLIYGCRPLSGGRYRVHASLIPAPAAETVEKPRSMDPSCSLAEISIPDERLFEHAIVDAVLDEDELGGLLMPARIALAGECLGLAAGALDRTLEWVSERRQFGRPVGGFQSIKHRIADAYVLFRKSLVCAHSSAARDDPAAAATARTLSSQAALYAARNYVQFLGGAGISWELEGHLYLKRALRLKTIFEPSAVSRQLNAGRFISRVLEESPGSRPYSMGV